MFVDVDLPPAPVLVDEAAVLSADSLRQIWESIQRADELYPAHFVGPISTPAAPQEGDLLFNFGALDVLKSTVRLKPRAVVLPTLMDIWALLDSKKDDDYILLFNCGKCLGAQVMLYLNPAAESATHLWQDGTLYFPGDGEHEVCVKYAIEDEATREFMQVIQALAVRKPIPTVGSLKKVLTRFYHDRERLTTKDAPALTTRQCCRLARTYTEGDMVSDYYDTLTTATAADDTANARREREADTWLTRESSVALASHLLTTF